MYANDDSKLDGFSQYVEHTRLSSRCTDLSSGCFPVLNLYRKPKGLMVCYIKKLVRSNCEWAAM